MTSRPFLDHHSRDRGREVGTCTCAIYRAAGIEWGSHGHGLGVSYFKETFHFSFQNACIAHTPSGVLHVLSNV